jgi:cell division protein FtsI (penicillin-binding protein 3)/stage V sporulation protein D (sporulation-specific penicillin-binding protein)
MNSDRIKILRFTIIISFFVVIFRLFYWQILQGQTIRSRSLNQIFQQKKILPNLGHLLTSDSFPISLDTRFYLLSLYKPNLNQKLDDLLSQIEKVKPGISSESAKQIEFFLKPNIKWVTLPTKFSVNEIKQINLPGVSFEEQSARFYPEGNLGLDVILNLESFYKRSLAGKTGFIISPVDASGEFILSRKNWHKSEVDGSDITLSLNRQIQSILVSSLKSGLDRFQAENATGIIIKPQTGEILAMATIPLVASSSSSLYPISHLYEPGSIFKPLVVAMALNEGSINLDFICPVCNKPRIYGQYTINNWDEKTHPNSTLRDVIKNSDNIAMSYIIEKLGLLSFQKYFHDLSLDQKTNVDLVGESISPLKKYWSDIDLATASFGQGFAINELQMLRAFNTLANFGKLTLPHLNTAISPKESDVFSTDTVNKVIDILKYAVENGAISSLKPNNLEVCAKSGTAQVAVGGQYTESDTVASYIGFSPCRNSKFTMIITLDKPKLSTWGSSTAAPIWFEIASKISPLL